VLDINKVAVSSLGASRTLQLGQVRLPVDLHFLHAFPWEIRKVLRGKTNISSTENHLACIGPDMNLKPVILWKIVNELFT
jgi:hypothetical protein